MSRFIDFRLDRFTTLHFMHLLRREPSGKAIPILMYHSIAIEDENDRHAYFRTATAPSIFEQHMSSLKQSGYSAISLREAVRRVKTCAEGTSKCVVITFDDGYHNFYTNAFPVLVKYGFSSVMFLPTALIGDRPLYFNGRRCLTWSEIRELEKHGISFGSHTATHPKLHNLGVRAIQEEVSVSKQTIEERLGAGVESFAYPYAFPETDLDFKFRMGEILRQAGYKQGVSTTVGRVNAASEPLFMERLPINSEDDPQLFKAKLTGGYDWVAKPQHILKRVKDCMSSR